jgi:hypothetical protein
MLDDLTEKEGRGVWLFAVFSTVLLIVLEFIFFAALIPGDWSDQVRTTELRWLVSAQGGASASDIVRRAEDWYQLLFVRTGLEPWSYQLLTTGPDFEPGLGMEKLGEYPFWDWLKGRLDVIWASLAQALQRLSMLLAWWPFLLLLCGAALGDGLLRRRIRQHSFTYPSPLAHHYAMVGMFWLVAIVIFLLLLPIPLPAVGVPVLGLIVAALIGIAAAHAQKRL